LIVCTGKVSRQGWLFELVRSQFETFVTLRRFTNPDILWRKFTIGMNIGGALDHAVKKELASSLHWQCKYFFLESDSRAWCDLTFPLASALAYDQPPVCPEIKSSSIEWEQSIVEGHPTHPVR
jgi:hypothetical protein